ncbi:MAG: hypothetical protein ACRCZF_01650 [Gemmataceae bacterium]
MIRSILTLLWTICCVQTSIAQDETLRKLISRSEGFGNWRCAFELTHVYEPGSISNSDPLMKLRADKEILPKTRQEFQSKGELISIQDTVIFKESTKMWVVPRKIFENHESVAWRTPQAAASLYPVGITNNGASSALIGRSPSIDKLLMAETQALTTNLFSDRPGLTPQLLSGLAFNQEVRSVQSKKCRVYSLEAGPNQKEVFYLSVDDNPLVLRIESLRNTKILSRIDIEYQSTYGPELPTAWKITRWESDGSVNRTIQGKLTQWEVLKDTSLTPFQVLVPSGTEVYNQLTDTTTKTPDGETMHLVDLIQDGPKQVQNIGSSGSRNMIRILLIICGLVLTLIAVFALWKKSR